MKAYLVTLGCPKNLVDSEAALSLLGGAGCSVAADPDSADVLIVNACSFLDASWQETVEEVHRLSRVKERGGDKKLVLMGCLPRHRQEDLEASLPQVDHFLPTGAHGRLPQLVEEWAAGRSADRVLAGNGTNRFDGLYDRALLTPSHTAYVKAAEGCNRTCTFCAIPTIRGRQDTRTVEDVMREVAGHVERGVREVTLLAQDIVSFRDGPNRLHDLIASISGTGIEWIRIFYLHPAGIDDDYIARLFDTPSVCQYLEMPIQHVSTRLLASMKRGYGRDHIERLMTGIRSRFPDAVIRSEVIVGFPGETEQDFDELMEFVGQIEFDSLGIFPYSREPGTVAADMPNLVGAPTIRARVEELTSLQEAISFGSRSRFIGRRLPVLIDRRVDSDEGLFDDCGYAGRFYGQALEIDGEVYLSGDDTRTVGDFVDVEVTEAATFDLKGEAIS